MWRSHGGASFRLLATGPDVHSILKQTWVAAQTVVLINGQEIKDYTFINGIFRTTYAALTCPQFLPAIAIPSHRTASSLQCL